MKVAGVNRAEAPVAMFALASFIETSPSLIHRSCTIASIKENGMEDGPMNESSASSNHIHGSKSMDSIMEEWAEKNVHNLYS